MRKKIEARELYLVIENTEEIDRYAKAKKVFNNVTELLITPDMRDISDCVFNDEKYNERQLSDFEMFARWERACPLCAGMGEAELYKEELKLLGLDAPVLDASNEEICKRWQTANNALSELVFDSMSENSNIVKINDFVSNFAKKYRGRAVSLYELVKDLKKYIECIGSNEVHIIFDVYEMRYERPDIYHANVRLERVACDEKYSDDFVVLSQLIVSIAGLLDGKDVSLHLYSEYGYDAIYKLISYLSEHSAFNGKILLGVFADISSDRLIGVCGRHGKLIVSPELILRPRDLGADLFDKLLGLFSRYPVGGMRFGGTLDCSMPTASHRILKKELAKYLCAVCDNELEARFLAQRFFES